MAQHIIVVEYNPQWIYAFEKEAVLVRNILGENCIAVYHIGSTAVPGLAAKPIIDIMPVVRNLERVDAEKAAFEGIGYEYLGEWGCPEEGICEMAETSERIKFISSLKAKRTILIGIWRFGII